MLLSRWLHLKWHFRPQQFNSTFPLVLDEDSLRGLLHRRRSLPWWQRERGPSRDGHGDAWAKHGFDLLSVKPPRTCFEMSRSEPGVLGGGTADSFDGLLRSICFSRALLVVYSDFPWFRWSPSHAMFSLSVSLFPLELWYRPMPLSSWIRLKIRFRPQYFNSTFPLVLDEDSRRGLLLRSKLLPWWQLEWGLSRDVLGDAWARAWIWSGPGELGGVLQTVLTDFCVQFASVVHCWLCTVIFNWFRGSPSHWRVFSFRFSISDWTVVSSNAPKQPVTPEETFQTSAVQFNFSTRLGWGFPPGTAAQEKIASRVRIAWNEDSVVTDLVMLGQEHGFGFCVVLVFFSVCLSALGVWVRWEIGLGTSVHRQHMTWRVNVIQSTSKKNSQTTASWVTRKKERDAAELTERVWMQNQIC